MSRSEYQPLNHHLTCQLASPQTPPPSSGCLTATFLTCYRRQCESLLVRQPTASCSSSYSRCCFSHPSHLGVYLIPRKQRPAPLLGEEGCSPLRVDTTRTEGGKAAPPCLLPWVSGTGCVPPSSGWSTLLLLFVFQQQLKLSTKTELATIHAVKTTSAPQSLTSEIR